MKAAHVLAEEAGKQTANKSALPPNMLAKTTLLTGVAPFLTRNRAMNKVPLFYGKFETEIASKEAVAQMSDAHKEAYVIRLIAKRFINFDTTKSYFTDPKVGKANPGLHQQTEETRMLRLQTATQTIDQYGHEYLKNAYDHVLQQVKTLAAKNPALLKNGEATVYITRPGRMEFMDDCTVNFLSLATQTKVCDSFEQFEKARAGNAANQASGDEQNLKLKFSALLPGTVLSRTARSNADPVGRLVQQGYYDVSHFQANDLVVIADDHTQAGSTLLSLGSALMDRKAHVLACITPTLHPHARSLAMNEKIRMALQTTLNKWDPEGRIMHALGGMGMSLDTLTNPEALILLAYATDPADVKALKTFRSLDSYLSMNDGSPEKVADGESDSLKPVLNKKFSVDEVLEKIVQQQNESRQVAEPVPTRQVHVLDWDDCLRSEKKMNYQLIHNAVAQLANMPTGEPKSQGEPIPLSQARLMRPKVQKFFEALARAMQPENRLAYTSDMPEVMLNEADFERFAMGDTDFTKKLMIENLINKANTLSDDLKEMKMDEPLEASRSTTLREAATNHLRSQFSLAYKALSDGRQIARSPLAGIASGHAQQAHLPLPYPDIRLEMMPHATELLNRLRTPDSRLVLISNRSHTDLEHEITQLNLKPYFDVVLGHQEVTSIGEQAEITGRLAKKPAAEKLLEALAGFDMRGAKALTLWGDRVGDMSQAENLPQQFGHLTKTGVLLNPSLPDISKPAYLDELKRQP